MTRQEWDAFRAQARLADGYAYDQHTVIPVTRGEEQVGTPDGEHRLVTAPMDVSGEAIGMLGIREDPDHPLSPEDRVLLRGISEQVAAALQRARLLEQTQSRARRERVIRDVVDRMQRAADMESLMRIAAEELTRALGASRAYVKMGTEDELTSDGW
jgi:GAF domain-containing protein